MACHRPPETRRPGKYQLGGEKGDHRAGCGEECESQSWTLANQVACPSFAEAESGAVAVPWSGC